MIGPDNMTMMHYNNYDGTYGYDSISIRLYHPFLWGSMAPCSLLSQLYWWWLQWWQWCWFIAWWWWWWWWWNEKASRKKDQIRNEMKKSSITPKQRMFSALLCGVIHLTFYHPSLKQTTGSLLTHMQELPN